MINLAGELLDLHGALAPPVSVLLVGLALVILLPLAHPQATMEAIEALADRGDRRQPRQVRNGRQRSAG